MTTKILPVAYKVLHDLIPATYLDSSFTGLTVNCCSADVSLPWVEVQTSTGTWKNIGIRK